MEQTKALNALEPFLALTKSATSPRSAADLITRATSSAHTYIFTSLLQAPQIQALSSSPDFASHLRLLEIFSYGTYADYVTSRAELPQLSQQQEIKLRQLSLLSLAKEPSNLSYANLINALGLGSKKALEDLVIEAIYAGLLTATLDPLHTTVLVSSIAPLRDVAPQSIPVMIQTLKEWESRCDETLRDLEAQIASIKAEAVRRATEERDWAAKVEQMIEKDSKGKGKAVQDSDSAENRTKGQHNDGGRGPGRTLGSGNIGDMGKQAWDAVSNLMQRQKRGHDGPGGEDEDGMDVDDGEYDQNTKPSAKFARTRGFGGS